MEQENEVMRRAAAFFARGLPQMRSPLVLDLAADGFPLAVDWQDARILQIGVLHLDDGSGD